MLFQVGNPGGPGRFCKRKSNEKLADVLSDDDIDFKQFREEFEWAGYLGDKSETSAASRRNGFHRSETTKITRPRKAT
jgi:hypothetical protein